jgi:uncharacterized protein YcbK (DUF882 family)
MSSASSYSPLSNVARRSAAERNGSSGTEEIDHSQRPKAATVLMEKASEKAAPTDVVLGYRNTKRIRELAERSKGRLVVADEKSAYFRLRPAELEPLAMYRVVKGLLRV